MDTIDSKGTIMGSGRVSSGSDLRSNARDRVLNGRKGKSALGGRNEENKKLVYLRRREVE